MFPIMAMFSGAVWRPSRSLPPPVLPEKILRLQDLTVAEALQLPGAITDALTTMQAAGLRATHVELVYNPVLLQVCCHVPPCVFGFHFVSLTVIVCHCVAGTSPNAATDLLPQQ